MLRFRIRFENNVFADLNKTAQDAPVRFREALKQRAQAVKTQALTALHDVPGPVVYADNGRLRWKNERQKRAFFASNGFGRGIPTGRVNEPGGVLGAYDVTVNAEGFNGSMLLINNYPGAEFIIGDFQQPFHADTGWQRVDNAAAEIGPVFADVVVAAWNEAVAPTGGGGGIGSRLRSFATRVFGL